MGHEMGAIVYPCRGEHSSRMLMTHILLETPFAGLSTNALPSFVNTLLLGFQQLEVAQLKGFIAKSGKILCLCHFLGTGPKGFLACRACCCLSLGHWLYNDNNFVLVFKCFID
jgi:hypothetical protein